MRRLEDARLLTGRGCYSDDFNLAGQVYAVVVRSPHAHARIIATETEHVRAMPGVLAVLTGADYVAEAGPRSTLLTLARQCGLPPQTRSLALCGGPDSDGTELLGVAAKKSAETQRAFRILGDHSRAAALATRAEATARTTDLILSRLAV